MNLYLFKLCLDGYLSAGPCSAGAAVVAAETMEEAFVLLAGEDRLAAWACVKTLDLMPTESGVLLHEWCVE